MSLRGGLTKAAWAEDIFVNIDLSMNVPVGVKGGVAIVKDISKPGGFGDLRCEKEWIVIRSNCPQEHYPSRWQSYSDPVDH